MPKKSTVKKPRGRPFVKPSERRSELIQSSLTAREWSRFERAKKRLECSESALIRAALAKWIDAD